VDGKSRETREPWNWNIFFAKGGKYSTANRPAGPVRERGLGSSGLRVKLVWIRVAKNRDVQSNEKGVDTKQNHSPCCGGGGADWR